MSKFDECLAETLKWEGGFSDDPYDPGGATMKGVTTARYNAYRRSKGLDMRPVKEIADDELRAIYRIYYWDYVWGDKLPKGLDLAVFDFGVNSGPARSIRYLQKVLGVQVDGHMGPVTMEAVSDCDPAKTAAALNRERVCFIRQIKTYWRFGKGWERRVKGIKAASQARAGKVVKYSAEPHSDPDRQSRGQARAEEKKKPVNAPTAGTVGTAVGVGGAIAAPKQVVEQLSSWQWVANGLKSFGEAAVAYWPFFVAAIAVWFAITYVVPWIYREWND